MTRAKKKKAHDIFESTASKVLIEFFGSMVIGAVFAGTYEFAIGGFFATALITMVMTYLTYEYSGGFLNPLFLGTSLIVGVHRKLGLTWADRLLRAVLYLLAQFLGVGVGILIAMGIRWDVLQPPSLDGWYVSAFFAETFAYVVYAFAYVLATDPLTAFRTTAVQRDGEVKNHSYINDRFGLIIFGAHMSLALLVGQTTGGAMNPLLAIWGNLMVAMFAMSWWFVIKAALYLGAGVLAAIIAGGSLYLLRILLMPSAKYDTGKARIGASSSGKRSRRGRS